jgi:hypothetical protein
MVTKESKMNNNYVLKFDGTNLPESLDPDIADYFRIMLHEAEFIFREKNNAYRRTFIKPGLPGILVRMNDKLSRLSSSEQSVADESLCENFLDIANYVLMGAMLCYFDLQGSNQCHHLYEVRQVVSATIMLSCVHCGEQLTANSASNNNP